jgi:SET domain-containing protein
MNKEQILKELANETFVALKPSTIHGIGVFALKDIPKGCRDIFSKNEINWVKIPINDVEQLPDHSKNLVETYCLYDAEYYFVPSHGFKMVDMVNYLNHSPNPNIIPIDEGEQYEALFDIPAGTELLVNYKVLVETDEYD